MTFRYHHVKVLRVIDGDTVELDIDMGNNTHWTDTFRLMGVDTPERGKPLHKEAADYLRTCCTSLVYVDTYKKDKYGRWLVDLFMAGPQSGAQLINALLIEEGLARPYYGGKKE